MNEYYYNFEDFLEKVDTLKPEVIELIRSHSNDFSQFGGPTPLMMAIFAGDEEAVDALIKSGERVNHYHPIIHSNLYFAIKCGNEKIVRMLHDAGAALFLGPDWRDLCADKAREENEKLIKLLVKSGTDMNTLEEEMLDEDSSDDETLEEDRCYGTYIEDAIYKGNIEMLKKMIDAGADVDFGSGDFTPLGLAVQIGNIEAVKLLLEAGAELKANYFNQGAWALGEPLFFTPLERALENQYYDIAKILIEKGDDIFLNGQGLPPIVLAFEQGQFELVDMMIARNLNVLTASLICKLMPLRYELIPYHGETLKYLVKKIPVFDEPDEQGVTPLFYACSIDNSFELVKILIDRGANVNFKNSSRMIPIDAAISNKSFDIARLLLDNGADLSLSKNSGLTNLLILIKNKNCSTEAEISIAAELLDAITGLGTDLNQAGNDGITPLLAAISQNNAGMLELLIKKGADIDQKDPGGRTPLMNAIINGHYQMAELLIGKEARLNISDNEGLTALHHAIMAKKLDLVKAIYLKGEVLKKSDAAFNDLFLLSLANNDDYLVECLLKEGADPNTCDQNGVPPICVISSNSVARSIIAARPNLNLKPAGKATLLHVVKSPLAAEYIIDNGLSRRQDIDLTDAGGRTPLHIAAETGNGALLKALVEKGASVNARDASGQTPLIKIIRWHISDHGSIELLLSKGSDANLADNEGMTPLHHALNLTRANDNHAKAAISSLIKYGANIKLKNNHGVSVLNFANSTGDFNLVNHIIKEAVRFNPNKTGVNSDIVEALTGHDIKSIRALSSFSNNDIPNDILFDSVKRADLILTSYLIACGAALGTSDRSGRSPLIIAIESMKMNIIELLLKNGALEETICSRCIDALKTILKKNRLDIVEAIVETGLDLNVFDSNDNTLMVWSIENMNDIRQVEFLINMGADINQANANGKTPLMTALKKKNREMVRLFIEKNAKVDQRDPRQAEMLETAIAEDQFELVEHLVKNGFSMSLRNSRGFLPQDHAISDEMKKWLEYNKLTV